jgi:hypothetical protein
MPANSGLNSYEFFYAQLATGSKELKSGYRILKRGEKEYPLRLRLQRGINPSLSLERA